MFRNRLLPLSLLLLPCAVSAQEAIATDRPDFVESSNVVGKNRFQFESSMAVDRDGAGRTWSTPLLLRYGVSDAIELRVETDGRIRTTAPGVRVTGYGDASFGMKWHVRDQQGGQPSVGILAHVDATTGSASFRAAGVRPSLRMVAEWELDDDVSVGVMPGLASEKTDDGRRVATGIFAVVAGKSWTERMRTFVEVALPRIARGRDGGSSASLDLGAAYLLNDDWQVDAALARGLNRNTPKLSLTFGLSGRL